MKKHYMAFILCSLIFIPLKIASANNCGQTCTPPPNPLDIQVLKVIFSETQQKIRIKHLCINKFVIVAVDSMKYGGNSYAFNMLNENTREPVLCSEYDHYIKTIL